MSAQQETLTPGERRFLERQKEAAKEGVTIQQYYRAHGLSVPALYSVRRQLISKGLLARAEPGQLASKPSVAPGRFVAVKLAPPTPTGPPAICRLRSPNGWLIECDELPDPVWLAGLMGVHT